MGIIGNIPEIHRELILLNGHESYSDVATTSIKKPNINNYK